MVRSKWKSCVASSPILRKENRRRRNEINRSGTRLGSAGSVSLFDRARVFRK
jgi:hypothetical protein